VCENVFKNFSSLEYLAQRLYLEVIPDPFSFGQDLWMDDMPDLLYRDVHVYSNVIETKGPYTQEKLRACKSLDAFNYLFVDTSVLCTITVLRTMSY